MKPKTLGILALLVGGLAAFVAFYERKLPSTDERKAQEKKVFRIESDDVVALEIENDGKKVRLERDARPKSDGEDAASFPPPREWRLVEPLTAKADRALADRLASDLAGLEVARRLEGVERKDVGLEPARGVVRWKTPEAEGALEIGGEVPASSNVVVAASGVKELLVVPKSIADGLTRAPGDWRSKEVVAATRDEIERIRLVPASGGEVVLSRKGDSFVLERPLTDAADRDLVDPLLSDLTGLKAEAFLDAPLSSEATAGLAASAGRIELSVKGRSEPISIELGAATDAAAASAEPAPPAPAADTAAPREVERYARVAGQAIEAKTRLADAIARAPEAWRSKAWSSFDSWKVERIRVEDAAGTMELKRDGGDWRRDGVKIPYTDTGDLLYAITSARAERLLQGGEAAAVPAGSPSETIVFADANGVEETLTLHGAVPGSTADAPLAAARVSGRDAVLALPQKAADEVVAKIAAVRTAKPVEEKPTEKPAEGERPPAEAGEPPPAAN